MNNLMTLSIISPVVQKFLAGSLMILGVSLLVYMIIVEDEPGVVPLLMIALGAGWFITVSRKANGLHE